MTFLVRCLWKFPTRIFPTVSCLCSLTWTCLPSCPPPACAAAERPPPPPLDLPFSPFFQPTHIKCFNVGPCSAPIWPPDGSAMQQSGHFRHRDHSISHGRPYTHPSHPPAHTTATCELCTNRFLKHTLMPSSSDPVVSSLWCRPCEFLTLPQISREGNPHLMGFSCSGGGGLLSGVYRACDLPWMSLATKHGMGTETHSCHLIRTILGLLGTPFLFPIFGVNVLV